MRTNAIDSGVLETLSTSGLGGHFFDVRRVRVMHRCKRPLMTAVGADEYLIL